LFGSAKAGIHESTSINYKFKRGDKTTGTPNTIDVF